MKRYLLVLPSLLLFFSLLVKAQEASFSFTTIDVPLPDVWQQSATAINDRNQIVGHFGLILQPGRHGFLYENGQFTFIDVAPPDSPYNHLGGINKKGQISGQLIDNNGVHFHGFLFDEGVTTLLDAPGAYWTEGFGLNDRGWIVGNYRVVGEIQHGFLYDSGTFVTIDVPGASLTAPRDINNRDQIVGSYEDNTGRHGFLYDSGLFTTIDVPFQNAQDTLASGINDHGDIVGLYSDGNVNHGFLLRDGVFTGIDVPGIPGRPCDTRGGCFTEIWGINKKGIIVGRYFDGISHAVVGFPIKD